MISADTIEVILVRKFSSHVRQYICAYHHLHNIDTTGGELNIEINLRDLENLTKSISAKQCTLDHDFAFIKAEIDDSDCDIKSHSRRRKIDSEQLRKINMMAEADPFLRAGFKVYYSGSIEL